MSKLTFIELSLYLKNACIDFVYVYGRFFKGMIFIRFFWSQSFQNSFRMLEGDPFIGINIDF